MTKEKLIHCKDCIYFKPFDGYPDQGHCHRYPPGIYLDPGYKILIEKLPNVFAGNYCGESE